MEEAFSEQCKNGTHEVFISSLSNVTYIPLHVLRFYTLFFHISIINVDKTHFSSSAIETDPNNLWMWFSPTPTNTRHAYQINIQFFIWTEQTHENWWRGLHWMEPIVWSCRAEINQLQKGESYSCHKNLANIIHRPHSHLRQSLKIAINIGPPEWCNQCLSLRAFCTKSRQCLMP